MRKLPDPGSQHVVLLAARDVTSERNGRIAVLESAVRGLQRAGHKVSVIAFTRNTGAENWLGCKVYRVAPPSIFALPLSIPRSIYRQRTLNQALFDSPRVRQEVKNLLTRIKADVVVGDNIRTWDAAFSSGLPAIMHLDDLLSERYSSKEFRNNNDSILGYFGDQIPAAIQPILEKNVKYLLGLEAKLAYRAENNIVKYAAVTALTSDEEAQRLERRVGQPVMGIPMAVPQKDRCTPSAAPSSSIAFLGVMHYGPNMAALRYLRDEILPELERRGRKVTVNVIGKSSEEQRAEFEGHPIEFAGYVENLAEALDKNRMFVSPILSGTGVKTKVLDALSVGLPIVATPLGVAGIPVTRDVNALVGHDTQEFVDAIEQLMDNPEIADKVGNAGYELLGISMNPDTVYDRWDQAVRLAVLEAGKKNNV